MKRRNLELVLAWLDALRRGDVRALRARLNPDVVWQGLRADLVCHGPDEVVAVFVSARDEGYDVDALELIPAAQHVVLGVRRAELREVAGVPLAGEIYNVFTIADDMIIRVEDHARRDRALAAAGLSTPPSG
jgi:ketosteroid isomerase-like protein